MEITNENVEILAKENVILANEIFLFARKNGLRNKQWYLNWQDDLNILTFDEEGDTRI